MVVIRLARHGAKHNPKYRITVADSRRWAKGKFIDILGHFDPSAKGKATRLNIDMDKANQWVAKGAQPSPRVKSLMKEAQGTKN